MNIGTVWFAGGNRGLESPRNPQVGKPALREAPGGIEKRVVTYTPLCF